MAWPQFRGPAGAGILDEGKLPTTWSAKDNIAWSVEVQGPRLVVAGRVGRHACS